MQPNGETKSEQPSNDRHQPPSSWVHQRQYAPTNASSEEEIEL